MFIVYTCVYVNALKSTFDLVIKIKNKKNKKRKKEERERERERERGRMKSRKSQSGYLKGGVKGF